VSSAECTIGWAGSRCLPCSEEEKTGWNSCKETWTMVNFAVWELSRGRVTCLGTSARTRS